MGTVSEMPEPVEIIVDIFEDNSNLAKELEKRNIGEVTVRKLITGDVVLRCNGYEAGLEIKRNQDFTKSLQDKRLHWQIIRCIREFDFAALVIESWSPYVTDETTEEHLKETVSKYKKTKRTLNRSITVEETKDQNETIELIEGYIDSMQKNKFGHLRRKVIIEDLDPQVNALCGYPNISPARARQLLELFGTPENAFAQLKDWIEINGITESRLAEIKRIWSEVAKE